MLYFYFDLVCLSNAEDHDAIIVDVFEEYVKKMHVDGDFGFAQLYEEITAVTKNYSYSSDISLLEANRLKNRYSNILTCKLTKSSILIKISINKTNFNKINN